MNSRMNLVAMAVITVSLALGGCAADTTDAGDSASEEALSSATTRSRIETFKGIDDRFYFHVVAANGEVVLQSESYESLSAAKGGVASTLDNAAQTSSVEMRTAKSGDSFFVIKAKNGEVIGTSEMYASRSNADEGAKTLRTLVRSIDRNPVPSATSPKFETFAGADGKTYFHLRARNGQIVLQSQGYASLQAAKKGVSSVRENALHEEMFETIETDQGGAFYFHLKAGNNEIIARSQTYASASNANRGRDSVIALVKSGLR